MREDQLRVVGPWENAEIGWFPPPESAVLSVTSLEE